MVAAAPASVRSLLEQATTRLIESESAALDAQVLLAHALGKSRTWLYTWPEAELSAADAARFAALLARRSAGEPVAYLIGQREFWSLELEVDPAVLIPRPETELLVALALALGPTGIARVADLGTGSGAIALALARERPQWALYATDISAAALAVAQRNCLKLGVQNLRFGQGSWCEPLPALAFDLVVSNPPYLAADDVHLEQGDLRFEPRSALVAAGEGLQDIRDLATQALSRLVTGGWLLVEHGWQQGAAVCAILATAGYTAVTTRHDAGDRERVTLGQKP